MEEGVGKATQMDGGQLISLSSDPQDLLKKALLILRTPAPKRRRHGSSPEPSSCSVNFSPCCVDLNISVAEDHQDPVSDDPNRWSIMARHLPGRTNNEIKNFWNTHLKKKLMQIGIDPVTHRPRTDTFSGLPQLKALAILKELVDQQSPENQAARSQNEAAQVADDLQYLQHLLQPLPAFSSNTLS